MEILLAAILVLLVLVLAGLVWMMRSPSRAGVDLTALSSRFDSIEKAQERSERSLREEIGLNRQEFVRQALEQRQELQTAFSAFAHTLTGEIAAVSTAQKNPLELMSRQMTDLTQSLEQKVNGLQETLDGRLQMTANSLLQDENSQKLEQIRHTVDEQLQSTLEKRLGESFKIVSDRLEQVHRGLGEMQNLASGVGDLKKLLSNVRARGTWGEVQLQMLLDQVLTADQYATNVATRGTSERVEFAIKLPGAEPEQPVWLPIDAKFPKEDYERLLDAVERGDAGAIEESSKQLDVRIRGCAKDIAEKYVEPPRTTDFAIMYLPTEGLYAEVLRRAGLIEALQHEYHVTVAGPMTLAAVLNSLQMGFRTLAIQKRSSEVWEVLGAVKTEFQKYSEVLAKVQKKLQEANNTVETGLTRTRAIQRKLKNVQELPAAAHEIAAAPEMESELAEIGSDV